MIANLAALVAVTCYELGRLLTDVGIALGALDGQETPEPLDEPACPDTVPLWMDEEADL